METATMEFIKFEGQTARCLRDVRQFPLNLRKS